MTKKPFSDIENIIRDASNASEAAFDEASWQKMEALLDKDKKRRPFIFWIFAIFGLFMVGAVVWIWPSLTIDKSFEQNTKKSATKNEIVLFEDANSLPLDVFEDNSSTSAVNIQPKNRISLATKKESLNQTINSNTRQTNDGKGGNSVVHVGTPKPAGIPLINNEKSMISNEDIGTGGKKKETVIINDLPATKYAEPENTIVESAKSNKAVLMPESKNDSLKSLTMAAIPEEPASTENFLNKLRDTTGLALEATKDSSFPMKKELRHKASSRFFVIASIGMETSSTKIFDGGKKTSRWGMGAGFQLTGNLSLQAAFYKSVKKYVAAGAAYKNTGGTYWSTVDIKSVNASCVVYEVPVILQYDFLTAKRLHYYIAGSLSSYLMKKEDYEYYYLRNGNPYYGAATYSGNKHLFSAVKLAAGISYQLNNRLMLTGSPALSIPLKGIGAGQVKLYSTELNFGIRYIPLHNK